MSLYITPVGGDNLLYTRTPFCGVSEYALHIRTNGFLKNRIGKPFFKIAVFRNGLGKPKKLSSTLSTQEPFWSLEMSVPYIYTNHIFPNGLIEPFSAPLL